MSHGAGGGGAGVFRAAGGGDSGDHHGEGRARLAGGRWRSTPHRVVNRSGHERLSRPLFFDPAFDAMVEPLPGFATAPGVPRWDGASVHDPIGTCGDYLLAKVGKVVPDLLAATG